MYDNGRPEIAVLCDEHGIVKEVLRDAFACRPNPGRHLSSLVDMHSRGKTNTFLQTILDRGAALDWEVNTASADGVAPLFFSGCATRRGIIILGYAKPRPVEDLGGELMRMTLEKPAGVQNGRAKSHPTSLAKTGAEPSLSDRVERLSKELIRVQQEVIKKNLDLEKQRIETFQDLATVVHGLRNPASGILSATEYLLDDDASGLEERHLSLLQSVVRSTLFMLRMIEDVLAVSTMQCGRLKVDLQPTDLVSMLKECLLLNECEAIRKEIRLDASFPTAGLILHLDPIKFAQVLDNVVSNAVKFSNPRSRIEIRLKIRRKIASISVQDEGPGIPADQMETIFNPFQSGGNGNGSAKTGTGLGLAISRQIVEGHAGKLTVKSEVGKGSTFTVDVPMVAAVPPRKAAPARHTRVAAQSA